MDTRKKKNQRQSEKKMTFKQDHGFIDKAVAMSATVFFIFCGIPVPTSFAGTTPVTLNEVQQPVATVTLEQANAQPEPLPASIPSGSTLQTQSPLSTPTPNIENPLVPEGWTRAASNANFAFRMTSERVGGSPYTNYTLYLRDLRTGEERVIVAASSPNSEIGVDPSGTKYDVTPDGQYVMYSTANRLPDGDYPYQTYIKKISDGTIALTAEGKFIALSDEFIGGYTGYKTLRLSHAYSEGTILETHSRINLQTLQLGTATYHIVNVGNGFSIDPQTGIGSLIFTVYPGDKRLMTFDSNTAKRLTDIVLASYPSTVKFEEFRNTTQGARIYSYAVDQAGYGPENYSYALDCRTGKKVTLTGLITAVSYDGNIAKYTLKMRNGMQTIQFVDLSTMKIISPVVPSGWTRAASNANFAFTVAYYRVSALYPPQYTLKLQDLRTGQIQNITTQTASEGSIADIYDVSPDGATVIYAISGPPSPTPIPQTIYVQRVMNPAQKVAIAGELQSITFGPLGNANLITRDAYPSGTVIEKTHLVLIPNFQVTTSPDLKLITRGTRLQVDSETSLVLQPEAYTDDANRVFIYDASRGTDHLRLVQTISFGSGPNGKYSFVDAYKTPGGKRIVSVGFIGYGASSSIIMNVATGKILSLANDGVYGGGANITGVSYSGKFATYTLLDRQSNTSSQVVVDLETLTVVPLVSVKNNADGRVITTHAVVSGTLRPVKMENYDLQGTLQSVTTYTWSDATHYSQVVKNPSGVLQWTATGEIANGRYHALTKSFPNGMKYVYHWKSATVFELTLYRNGVRLGVVQRYEIRIVNGRTVSVLL